jgi:hypothetical protein
MTMRTTSTTDPKRAEHPHEAKPTPRVRPPAQKADVERFREAFAAAERQPIEQRPRQPEDATVAPPALRKHDDASDSLSAESLAIAQAGRMAEIAPAVASDANAPRSGASTELAELIEKHVRRLLVSDDAAHGGRDARVMLRIGNGVLAGADLVLTRDESGWLLHADVADERQAEAMRESAPGLARRFAENGLGAIAIETASH